MKQDAQSNDGHHRDNEVEIVINGTAHKTHRGTNSVAHLKELGHIPLHDTLVETKGERHLELQDGGEVEIHGGEVFTSHERGKHHHHLVKIKINGVDYETHTGENSVAHLRELGHVPADEILSQFKDGKFVDLGDAAHVEIHGGEIFASHKPTGGTS